MRTTPVSPCLAFLLAALAFGGPVALAEADVRVLAPDESPGNWAAPPFWVPPGQTRNAEGGAAAARTALTSNPPALPFFAIAPCRLADTRSVGGGGIIPPAVLRNFQIAGICNIPPQAQAVSFNFTVTNTQGSGFLVAYPFGAPFPTVSILNFVGGQTLANGAIVALGSGAISTAMGTSAADLVIDVNGYYAPTGIVASLNNLTGDVSVAAGANVTITPSGNTLTIAAPLTGLNASNVTSGLLGITFGGTGAATAAGARTALGAATSGANTDITSLSNLTTPLSVTQGGTGSTTAVSARTALGAAARGANADITSLSTLTTPLSVTQGGTGSTTAVNARAALGAASRGANADITSLSTLTTPLSIAQGGTGSATPFASAFQARITGTCAPGSYVTNVAANGTVGCSAPVVNPLPGFKRTVVDTGAWGYSGAWTMAGSDGLPLVAYVSSGGFLKIAHCQDPACLAATTTLVSTNGAWPSVTVGTDGLGLIAFNSGTQIFLARCNDLACSGVSTTVVDPGSNYAIGQYLSAVLGTDGLLLIAYRQETTNALRVAHCNDASCSSPVITTHPSVAGSSFSLTIGDDGLGLISYTTAVATMAVAHCNDVACTSVTASAPDTYSFVGPSTAATTGADGLGLIAYHDGYGGFRVAHCTNPSCSTAGISVLGVGTVSASDLAITTGSDGLGLVTFYDLFAQSIRVAHCRDVACTSASFATIDVTSGIRASSVAVGGDGFAFVSYFDLTTGKLKVAHCSNTSCVPFFRRR